MPGRGPSAPVAGADFRGRATPPSNFFGGYILPIFRFFRAGSAIPRGFPTWAYSPILIFSGGVYITLPFDFFRRRASADFSPPAAVPFISRCVLYDPVGAAAVACFARSPAPRLPLCDDFASVVLHVPALICFFCGPLAPLATVSRNDQPDAANDLNGTNDVTKAEAETEKEAETEAEQESGIGIGKYRYLHRKFDIGLIAYSTKNFILTQTIYAFTACKIAQKI